MSKEQKEIKEKIKFWEREISIEAYRLKIMKSTLKDLKEQLSISGVGVTSCDCNKPRYINKGDVLRCTECNKASAIV